MINTENIHKINLIDGIFSPSEASDIINSLIKEKINFHKLHRLSLFEGNVDSITQYDDSRINELMREKEDFKSMCKKVLLTGKNIKISGTLNIEIIDY